MHCAQEVQHASKMGESFSAKHGDTLSSTVAEKSFDLLETS